MKKFLLSLAALLGVASVAGAQNHALKLTQGAAKDNSWDSQTSISVKNLEKGKAYTISFKLKLEEALPTGKGIGTQTIDAQQTDHKDIWNNSAVFNYTTALNAADSKKGWQDMVISFTGKTNVTCHAHCTALEVDGKTDHGKHGVENEGKPNEIKYCTAETLTDFEYAAKAIIINWGQVPNGQSIYIDDVVVKDAAGKTVFTQDFEGTVSKAEYDATKDVYYPGYHSHITVAVVESESATPVEDAEADVEVVATEYYTVNGVKVDAPVKGINIVKQTLSNGATKVSKIVK